MKDNCTYYDFFGLPGSGKTTAVNCLRNRISSSKHKIYDSFEDTIFSRNRLFVFTLMLYTFRIENIILLYNIISFTAKLNFRYNGIFRRSFKLYIYILNLKYNCKYENSMIISDNGVVQFLSSIVFTSAYSKQDIVKIIDSIILHLPVNFHFIYVKAEKTIAKKRMLEREMNSQKNSKDRAYNLEPEQREILYDELERFFDICYEHLLSLKTSIEVLIM